MAATYQYLININEHYKQDPKVRAKIKELEKAIGGVGKVVKPTTKKMGDFERAIRRAAVVAPVWLLLRSAMMSFLRGFSEGFKYMEEFDRAMLKAQAVVHGAVGTMADTVEDLRGRIRNLSQTTGESMTNIAAAFYKFGTVGMEFEAAWAGAEASVRIAIATMGDAVKMSKTLALSFKLLGDSIDKSIPIGQAYEIQMAKLYKLWQINAFEADEFTASLQNFLPTANIMNLSMDETNALLATLGSAAIQGARGGRLLRTSFSKLLDNTNKLATSLGIYVNPELENSFTLFMKVLGAIKKLTAEQELPLAAQDIIKNVFGGVRGGEPIRGLVALYDELNKNLDITTGGLYEQKKMLEEYDKRVNDVIVSVSGQLKIFRELRKQLFEQFLTGALGTEDFVQALQASNMIMAELVDRAYKLGEFFHRIGTEPLGISSLFGLGAGTEKLKQLQNISKEVKDALEGKLPLQRIIELSTELEIEYPKDSELQKVAQRLKNLAKDISKDARIVVDFQARVGKKITDYDEEHFKKVRDSLNLEEESIDINKNILKQINLQKKSMKEQVTILKMQAEGYSEADIAIAEISLEANKLAEEYNTLDKIIDGTVPALNKQTFLSKILSENWEDVVDSLIGYPDIQERILALAKQVNGVELEKQKILNRQKDILEEMAISYEKADVLDQARIHRLMELVDLSPEEQMKAYRVGGRDQKIIIENLDKFEKAIQEFVAAEITRERDLPRKHPDEIYMEMLDKMAGRYGNKIPPPPPPPSPLPPQISVINKGAEVINVAIQQAGTPSEETLNTILESLKNELKEDSEFRRAFFNEAAKIIPVNRGGIF